MRAEPRQRPSLSVYARSDARRAFSERHDMAGAFVSLVLDSVRDVTPGALLTLVSLADRANRDRSGQAWPSLRDIAARTNRQERQIRCDLRELEMAGWIRRCGNGQGGRGLATTYELNVPAMLHAMPTEKAAAHCREMRKLPGILGPGFTLNKTANPAVNDTKPGSQEHKPGTPLPQTRHYTAPEPEVEPESITGFEPEAHARANSEPHDTGAALPFKTILKKLNTEPESTVPNASVGGSGNKPRLGRKTPNPTRVETDAERLERLEANKRRQVDYVAAVAGKR